LLYTAPGHQGNLLQADWRQEVICMQDGHYYEATAWNGYLPFGYSITGVEVLFVSNAAGGIIQIESRDLMT
jgi:purine nucleoside phosphorylase